MGCARLTKIRLTQISSSSSKVAVLQQRDQDGAVYRPAINGKVVMTDEYPPLKSPLSSVASVFPTLTPAQMERVAARGQTRQVQAGEILVEAGEKDRPFFVIKSGQV